MYAQSDEDVEMIMNLLGYDEPEDLDEYEVERLSSYLERPVKINVASTSYLRSCGLFSQFQAASLLDYRARHGDLMSYNELALVDGFTEESVRLLTPFISLSGGSVGTDGVRHDGLVNDLAIKGGIKVSDKELSEGYALKYRCTSGDGVSVAFSASCPYDKRLDVPDVLSGHIAWEPFRKPFRIIAGDFNARFGQGLALWNGMSMTGLSKTSSFFRSASGISSSWSFTGGTAHTGVAGELSIAKLRLSAFVAFPGIKSGNIANVQMLPAFNLCRYGRNMSWSLTHYLEYVPARSGNTGHIPDMKTSADISMCISGTDVFSEIAFDWVSRTVAALAGVRFPAGEDVNMACHLRYYPASFSPLRSAAPRSVSKCSNEYGASFCCDYMPYESLLTGSVSFDAAYLPVSKDDKVESVHMKAVADCEMKISDFLRLKLRLSERFRTWGRNYKTDVRADLIWEVSGFSLSGRFNMMRYVDTGFLGYLESGYKAEKLSIYLRQLFFSIDDWDDRIYVYERDAPGSFSVPAFYGRGMNTAFMASWRFSKWGRIYAKASLTTYPFMPQQKKKPGKAELKLQCVFSF